MRTDISSVFQPVPKSGIDGVWNGRFSACKKTFLYVAYRSFYASFFVGTMGSAWINTERVVIGKGCVISVELCFVAVFAWFYHSCFAVIDHDVLGNTAKVFKGVTVSCQPKFNGFAEEEFNIEHSTVA